MSNNYDYLEYSHYKDELAVRTLISVVEQVSKFAKKTNKNSLRILDLGCGIGGISFPLSFLGHSVTGVDIHPESIEFCKNKNTFSNAKYLAADGATLDLQGHFDIVICIGVLEHVPQPSLLLKTIKDFIGKSGITIINIPNGYSIYEILFSRICQKIRITKLFHKLPKRIYTALTGSDTPYDSLNVFCDHVQFFLFHRFKSLLRKSGFQLLDTANIGLGLFLGWKCFRTLKYLECKLANYVPHSLAGSWVFVAKFNEDKK
ncbi:MAG: methyltransferase domain-containing protein [Candidatus Brocadiaceae bacterium]|nr:methyltransferase domain-containing protein [Candidatus Brocadiaceae bacterium]